MSGWKLDPAGIQSILEKVNAEAEGLNTDMVGTEAAPVNHGADIFDGLKWAPELTSDVALAVESAMIGQEENIATIANHINAGQLGVFNATVAYNQGDLAMAAGFQTEASKAAETGDFSFFDSNGVK